MTEAEIDILVKERSRLLDIDYNDPKADEMTVEIIKHLKENSKTLSVDFIVESFTKLGHCPSILYDDNGFFSVQSDGMQDLPIDSKGNEKLVTGISFVIEDKESWQPTIREAIEYWLKSYE
jgi:hypothetical protein